MFVILSTRQNRQLSTTIQDLYDRSESHRRRQLEAEQRIEQALELLEDHDDDLTQKVRAILKADQQ